MFLQRSVIEFSFYYCSMIVVGVGGSLIYCKMEKKLSLTIHVVLFSYCYKNFLSFFLIISLYIYIYMCVCARIIIPLHKFSTGFKLIIY